MSYNVKLENYLDLQTYKQNLSQKRAALLLYGVSRVPGLTNPLNDIKAAIVTQNLVCLGYWDITSLRDVLCGSKAYDRIAKSLGSWFQRTFICYIDAKMRRWSVPFVRSCWGCCRATTDVVWRRTATMYGHHGLEIAQSVPRRTDGQSRITLLPTSTHPSRWH